MGPRTVHNKAVSVLLRCPNEDMQKQTLTHLLSGGKTDVAVTACHLIRMTTQTHVEEVVISKTTTGERRAAGNAVSSDK